MRHRIQPTELAKDLFLLICLLGVLFIAMVAPEEGFFEVAPHGAAGRPPDYGRRVPHE
jgi:hypothetical protein